MAPKIVVAGASAGGVEALRTFVRALPADLDAAVFIVLHVPATVPSALASILRRSSALPVDQARDRTPIRPGRIVVAPPNFHVALSSRQVHLTDGPRENGLRPAANVLFRSAAAHYGRNVIGVVMSGTGSDGASGLAAIRQMGGLAVVQDPCDALFDGMPTAALDRAGADHIVPITGLGPLLADLCNQGETIEETDVTTDGPESGNISPGEGGAEKRLDRALGLTCPDCAGPIWDVSNGELKELECRIGHRYNPEAFVEMQATRVENALWTAVQVLQERAETIRLIADRLSTGHSRDSFNLRIQELERDAETVRSVIVKWVHDESPNGAS
jgi:two-component system chemotaxis response regulator CheB